MKTEIWATPVAFGENSFCDLNLKVYRMEYSYKSKTCTIELMNDSYGVMDVELNFKESQELLRIIAKMHEHSDVIYYDDLNNCLRYNADELPEGEEGYVITAIEGKTLEYDNK